MGAAEPAVAGTAGASPRDRGHPRHQCALERRRRHRARLPERGRRRAQAARGRPRAGRGGRRGRSPSPRRRTSRCAGQIVDRDEVRDAAQSRVEVTQAVLESSGSSRSGAVMDPDPAARARRRGPRLRAPRGAALVPVRHPLRARPARTWSSGPSERFEVPVTHIPVRIEDDAVRWDVTHTLVVATQTVASPDLIAPSEAKGRRAPSPLHVHQPALGPADPRGGLRAARRARSPSSTAPTSTRPASR